MLAKMPKCIGMALGPAIRTIESMLCECVKWGDAFPLFSLTIPLQLKAAAKEKTLHSITKPTITK